LCGNSEEGGGLLGRSEPGYEESKTCRGNQKREANTNRQRSKKSNLRSVRTTLLDNDRFRRSSIKGCLDDATGKKIACLFTKICEISF